MKKSSIRLIMTIMCSLTLSISAGCTTDDGPLSRDAMMSDIVTVVSSSPEQGTVFSFNRYDDSPLITLSAPGYTTIPEIKPGDRVLLYYYPQSGQPYTSGDIRVRSLGIINNGTIYVGDNVAQSGWDATPVWLTSVWRTGRYLNFRLRLSYAESPRRFMLAVDKNSVSNQIPDVYLVHDLDGQPDSYLRDVIASFDISEVWDRPSCNGITLHINDTNLGQDTYTFTK